MNVEVKMDAETINQTISRAIAESAIGKELERVIQKQVDALSRSFDNPIEAVVKQEIGKVIEHIVTQEYGDMIREKVRERVSEQFTDNLFNKMWDAFVNKY